MTADTHACKENNDPEVALIKSEPLDFCRPGVMNQQLCQCLFSATSARRKCIKLKAGRNRTIAIVTQLINW